MLHNHQPIGNFGWVVESAYRKAYEPMLGALERHPRVRVGLHYTGPLLEWLANERPEFVARLASLVERGQVELLGGGLYEPILAAIPERDRLDQLRRMATAVGAITGREPQGAWLAERVWEPDVPTALVDAGYLWTVLDDAHFRAAAVDESAIHGAYTTDDQGRRLTLFATDRRLRYGVPYASVASIVGYLRSRATAEGDHLAVMGDDGEKFGSWPRSFDHCWGEGRWVERFFGALERAADRDVAITTVTPSGWLAEHGPVGRIYVPTASYDEMGEWSLPPEESIRFVATARAASADRSPVGRWLRGGFWRNYQARYREVNDLHKQMLRVSAKVDAMADGPARDTARDHLHRGQSNDCYWHGIFGGIYLAHMRLATIGHLIAAEDIADTEARRDRSSLATISRVDVDLDGADEVLVNLPGQVVSIDPGEGGAIGSWSVRAARHDLAAVMRRRPEAYHARLREAGRRTDRPSGAGVSQAVTIHDVAHAADKDLIAKLVYDIYERRSGLVHLLARGTTREAFIRSEADWLGDAHSGPYVVETTARGRITLTRTVAVPTTAGPAASIRIRKRYAFGSVRAVPELDLSVGLEHLAGPPATLDLAIEWSINLLGGGNPDAWYRIDGETLAHDSAGERPRVGRLAAGNRGIGIEVGTAITPATILWWSPIETISASEAGFEATVQGSSLVSVWPLELRPGEARVVAVRHRIQADDV